jgi:hypothetical protein
MNGQNDDRATMEAEVDLYKTALGMDFKLTPLGAHCE